MPKKSADAWFAEYGDSHQHHANELIHWLCVPVIFFCVLAFIWTIPVPLEWQEAAPWFNWALVGMAIVTLFYLRLSPAISAGMLFFMAVCYTLLVMLEIVSPWPLWRLAAVAFVVAWVGQVIGHKIEGKKPSFLKDIVFLLIGPAWLMSKIYRRIGQKY
jgi:uncharacterized membrane protein YGL010W